MKISIKLRVFNDRLFVSSHGRRGGGGGGGGMGVYTGGLMEGVGNIGVGGNNAVGAIGGGQQWGCCQPLRTALHNMSINLQNSLS